MIVSIMNFEQLPSAATAVSSTNTHQIMEEKSSSSHFDYDIRINGDGDENYLENNSKQRSIIHSGLSQRDIDVEIISPISRTISDNTTATTTTATTINDNNNQLKTNTNNSSANIEQELSKKVLKLELNQQNDKNDDDDDVKEQNQSINSTSPSTSSIIINGVKSPVSQTSRSSGRSINTATTITTPTSAVGAAAAVAAAGKTMSHQASITSQVDVIEDRKALRDALYQGIFHRHRRTIFAVGSFIRMLKSRNAQYNTIRSSSEGEDDPR